MRQIFDYLEWRLKTKDDTPLSGVDEESRLQKKRDEIDAELSRVKEEKLKWAAYYEELEAELEYLKRTLPHDWERYQKLKEKEQ